VITIVSESIPITGTCGLGWKQKICFVRTFVFVTFAHKNGCNPLAHALELKRMQLAHIFAQVTEKSVRTTDAAIQCFVMMKSNEAQVVTILVVLFSSTVFGGEPYSVQV
jgi:hypothetical protein